MAASLVQVGQDTPPSALVKGGRLHKPVVWNTPHEAITLEGPPQRAPAWVGHCHSKDSAHGGDTAIPMCLKDRASSPRGAVSLKV